MGEEIDGNLILSKALKDQVIILLNRIIIFVFESP